MEQNSLSSCRVVHVTYTLTKQDAKTGKTSRASLRELWPVTFENNRGLNDRNNLIDFHSLTLPVQNTTHDTMVSGQANEILAAFTFPSCMGELDDRSQTGLITTINLHQRTKRT